MKLIKGLELTSEEYVVIKRLIGKLSTDKILSLGLSKSDDILLEYIYGKMVDLEGKYLED